MLWYRQKKMAFCSRHFYKEHTEKENTCKKKINCKKYSLFKKDFLKKLTVVNVDDTIHIISAKSNNNRPNVSLWDKLCIILASMLRYGKKRSIRSSNLLKPY